MMLINSSKCCGKKCNLSLASMPSSLLKFCTHILGLLAFRNPLHKRVGGGRFAALQKKGAKTSS
jgi:hypothetical protein